jgi:hypothetical protein
MLFAIIINLINMHSNMKELKVGFFYLNTHLANLPTCYKIAFGDIYLTHSLEFSYAFISGSF